MAKPKKRKKRQPRIPHVAHAFTCCKCHAEWRCAPVPIPKNTTGLQGYQWPFNACPACGHLYIEWHSYDSDPKDVCLWRSGEKVPTGTLRIKRGQASVQPSK